MSVLGDLAENSTSVDEFDATGFLKSLLGEAAVNGEILSFPVSDTPCEPVRDEDAVFFVAPGTNTLGDDGTVRLLNHRDQVLVDASRPSNVSRLGIAENNSNQLLHLIFLNQIADCAQVRRIRRCGACLRKEPGWFGTHETAHGFHVVLEPLEDACSLREFCTSQSIARAAWMRLSAKKRRAAFEASSSHGCFESAPDVYLDDAMIAPVFVDMLDDLVRKIVHGQRQIQSHMSSTLFLSLDSITVHSDPEALFGVNVKFWPDKRGTFVAHHASIDWAVHPRVRFNDHNPVQNVTRVGLGDFLVDLFVTGASRFDERGFGDTMSEAVGRMLSATDHTPGVGALLDIALRNRHAQAYDVMRVAYELMFLSPIYSAGSSYRTHGLTVFDTPILGHIMATEERARTYLDGTRPPSLASFRIFTGNLALHALRQWNATRIIELAKEPTLPVSATLADLDGPHDDYLGVLSEDVRLDGAARFAKTSFALDLRDSNLLTRIHTLLSQGSVGVLVEDLRNLPHANVPDLANLSEYEIARGAGGAVFRVRLGDTECAMKLPLQRVDLRPTTHTNRILDDQTTLHRFTNDANVNELLITALTSQLYDEGKSPHFINLKSAFGHERGIGLVMEKIHGDMYKADAVFQKIILAHVEHGVPSKACPTLTQLATNVVAQTIFAIDQFQTLLHGMHNDCHLANVFLKICDDTLYNGQKLVDIPYWTYETAHGTYHVPNLGILVKLGDFGLSTCRVSMKKGSAFELASHAVFTSADRTDSFLTSDTGRALIERADAWSSTIDVRSLISNLNRGTNPNLDRNMDILVFFRHLRLHPRFQQLRLVHEHKIMQALLGARTPADFERHWAALFTETTTLSEMLYLLIRTYNGPAQRSLMAEVQSILVSGVTRMPSIEQMLETMPALADFKTPADLGIPAVPLSLPSVPAQSPTPATMRAERLLSRLRRG